MEIERAWICKVALQVCRETRFHANRCVFGCGDGPEVDALNTARQILRAVCVRSFALATLWQFGSGSFIKTLAAARMSDCGFMYIVG